MKVFKFGGASVSTPERMKNVGRILQSYQNEKLLVVVSALGKTTNALEKVVEAFYRGEKENALSLFSAIKNDHLAIAAALLGSPTTLLNDFFTEVEWLLHDKPVRGYDYYYDQVVAIGEMLSTTIISAYLNEMGLQNQWIDVRDIIRTDNNFRDAKIAWDETERKVNDNVQPIFSKQNLVITQGFIGATDENESTTLGREGSDYTAAVFANLLNAESQTIWKDVVGVMNADPKEFEEAVFIHELNYREVIEMAYYGAQVIHPKTVKPLQNKHIPLYVRSFLEPEREGTIIHTKSLQGLPPIIVNKKNQVLVQLSSKDFSFVGEGLTAEIYSIFETLKIKPNLTQNAAISMLCVLDDHAEKVDAFAQAAAQHFDVQVMKNLNLLTIRHYQEGIIKSLSKGQKIMLQQQTPETVQLLLQATQ